MYTTFNIIKNKLNIKDIIVVKIVLLKTKYAPSGKTNLVKYSEFANKHAEEMKQWANNYKSSLKNQTK